MATKVFHLQRAVADAVRQLIECPVCKQTLRVPFKECSRGHNICSRCAEPLPACSVCGGSFYTENPEGATRLLNSLPKLCQYSGNGCPLLLEGEENQNHEVKCEYRPAKCCHQKCSDVVPLREMLAHFQENHKQDYISNCCLIGSVDVNVNYDSCKLIPRKHSLFYWLQFANNIEEDQLEVRVFSIRNTWPYEFSVKLQIGEKDPYVYSYAFHPSLVEALEDTKKRREADRFCMKIPREAMKIIADDGGNFKCIVMG